MGRTLQRLPPICARNQSLLRSIPGFLDVRYRLGDLSVDVNCAQDIGGLAIHLKYPSDVATGQIDTGGCRNASSAWPNAQASHPAHSFCVASSFQTTRFGTIHLLGADAPAPSSLCRQLIRNATLSTSLVLLDHPMGGYDGSIDIAWVTPEEPVVVASPEPLDRVETWHS